MKCKKSHQMYLAEIHEKISDPQLIDDIHVFTNEANTRQSLKWTRSTYLKLLNEIYNIRSRIHHEAVVIKKNAAYFTRFIIDVDLKLPPDERWQKDAENLVVKIFTEIKKVTKIVPKMIVSRGQSSGFHIYTNLFMDDTTISILTSLLDLFINSEMTIDCQTSVCSLPLGRCHTNLYKVDYYNNDTTNNTATFCQFSVIDLTWKEFVHMDPIIFRKHLDVVLTGFMPTTNQSTHKIKKLYQNEIYIHNQKFAFDYDKPLQLNRIDPKNCQTIFYCTNEDKMSTAPFFFNTCEIASCSKIINGNRSLTSSGNTSSRPSSNGNTKFNIDKNKSKIFGENDLVQNDFGIDAENENENNINIDIDDETNNNNFDIDDENDFYLDDNVENTILYENQLYKKPICANWPTNLNQPNSILRQQRKDDTDKNKSNEECYQNYLKNINNLFQQKRKLVDSLKRKNRNNNNNNIDNIDTDTNDTASDTQIAFEPEGDDLYYKYEINLLDADREMFESNWTILVDNLRQHFIKKKEYEFLQYTVKAANDPLPPSSDAIEMAIITAFQFNDVTCTLAFCSRILQNDQLYLGTIIRTLLQFALKHNCGKAVQILHRWDRILVDSIKNEKLHETIVKELMAHFRDDYHTHNLYYILFLKIVRKETLSTLLYLNEDEHETIWLKHINRVLTEYNEKPIDKTSNIQYKKIKQQYVFVTFKNDESFYRFVNGRYILYKLLDKNEKTELENESIQYTPCTKMQQNYRYGDRTYFPYIHMFEFNGPALKTMVALTVNHLNIDRNLLYAVDAGRSQETMYHMFHYLWPFRRMLEYQITYILLTAPIGAGKQVKKDYLYCNDIELNIVDLSSFFKCKFHPNTFRHMTIQKLNEYESIKSFLQLHLLILYQSHFYKIDFKSPLEFFIRLCGHRKNLTGYEQTQNVSSSTKLKRKRKKKTKKGSNGGSGKKRKISTSNKQKDQEEDKVQDGDGGQDGDEGEGEDEYEDEYEDEDEDENISLIDSIRNTIRAEFLRASNMFELNQLRDTSNAKMFKSSKSSKSSKSCSSSSSSTTASTSTTADSIERIKKYFVVGQGTKFIHHDVGYIFKNGQSPDIQQILSDETLYAYLSSDEWREMLDAQSETYTNICLETTYEQPLSLLEFSLIVYSLFARQGPYSIPLSSESIEIGSWAHRFKRVGQVEQLQSFQKYMQNEVYLGTPIMLNSMSDLSDIFYEFYKKQAKTEFKSIFGKYLSTASASASPSASGSGSGEQKLPLSKYLWHTDEPTIADTILNERELAAQFMYLFSLFEMNPDELHLACAFYSLSFFCGPRTRQLMKFFGPTLSGKSQLLRTMALLTQTDQLQKFSKDQIYGENKFDEGGMAMCKNLQVFVEEFPNPTPKEQQTIREKTDTAPIQISRKFFNGLFAGRITCVMVCASDEPPSLTLAQAVGNRILPIFRTIKFCDIKHQGRKAHKRIKTKLETDESVTIEPFIGLMLLRNLFIKEAVNESSNSLIYLFRFLFTDMFKLNFIDPVRIFESSFLKIHRNKFMSESVPLCHFKREYLLRNSSEPMSYEEVIGVIEKFAQQYNISNKHINEIKAEMNLYKSPVNHNQYFVEIIKKVK